MEVPASMPRVPGYRVLALLGAGGGGAVYRAVQESLNREVALKVLHREVWDELSSRRFLREGQAMSRLSHPNVVRVLDCGTADGMSFLAMELFECGTLRGLLDARPPPRTLNGAEVVRLAEDLLRGLDALHATSLVHRDLKPANVFLRDSGAAVLGDFGLVRPFSGDSTRLTTPGTLVGTLAYLPPEAFRGDLVWGPAQDLFSLGVTLHEAITGAHPNSFQPFWQDFRAPRPDDLPLLGDVVATLLAPDPASRPSSAREALAALPPKGARRSHRAPSTLAAVAATIPTPAAPRRRSAGTRALAASVLVAAAFVAGRFTAAPPPRSSFPVRPADSPRPTAAVTVLGLGEHEGGRRLWLAVRPAARIRWQGAVEEFPAGPSGASIPVGPSDTHAASARVLLISFEPTWNVSLCVDVPAAPAERGVRLPELGVVLLPATPTSADRASRPLTAADWMLEDEPGWVALRAPGDGTAPLDPALRSELSARFGARTVLLAEHGERREALSRSQDPSAPPMLRFVGARDRPTPEALAARARRVWAAAGRGEHVGYWMGDLTPHLLTRLLEGERAPSAVAVWPSNDEESFWKDHARAFRANQTGGAERGVRWLAVWFGIGSTVDFGLKTGLVSMTSFDFARMYVLGRIHFPGATVLVDMDAGLRVPAGDLRSSWRRVQRAASALAGLRYLGPVDPGPGCRPRVESSGAVTTASFADERRRVHVLMPARLPVRGRLFPCRPCVLQTADPKDPTVSVERMLLTTAPVPVHLGMAPSFIRELSRVYVRPAPGAAVELMEGGIR